MRVLYKVQGEECKFMKAKIKNLGLAITVGSALALLAPAVAMAGTITFTGIGTANSESVDASAVVTFGAGTVSITLENLITGQKDAGQSLTGFSFDLGNWTSSAASLTSSDANEINVVSGGAITSKGTVGSNWGNSLASSTLSVLWFTRNHSDANFTGNASGGLLGVPDTSCSPADAAGCYPDANSSLTNGAHTPEANGDLVFNFSIPGVSSTTTASNAVFYFSTTPYTYSLPGTPVSPVPEPASLLLLGSGLLGLAWFARKGLLA